MKLSYTKDAKRAAKEMRGKKKKKLFLHSDLAFIGTPIFPKDIKPSSKSCRKHWLTTLGQFLTVILGK